MKVTLERIRTQTEPGFVAEHIRECIKILMILGSAAEHIPVLTRIPMASGFAVVSTRELTKTRTAPGLSVEHTLVLIKTQTENGCAPSSSNMALNLAPFGIWRLREKAAQRRLALR